MIGEKAIIYIGNPDRVKYKASKLFHKTGSIYL